MISAAAIISRENTRLKQARRARDGKEDASMFVEGVRLCEEALRSGLGLQDCFVTAKALKNERVQSLAAELDQNQVKIHELSDELFRSIADTENPQGVALVCYRPPFSEEEFENAFDVASDKLPLVVFLGEANNPANLGAVIRTAEAAGVAGIIISRNSADPFAPRSLRASMGSAFRMPIWFGPELKKAVGWATEHEMVSTAADIRGSKVYTEIDWRTPRLLVFGSEAHGLSESDRIQIQDLIRIPINDPVESLNLAISAGVVLFEARRQRS